MIIFVGDKPSKQNLDPDIPFVGTQSYKKLLSWIAKLDVDYNDSVICNVEHLKIDSMGHMSVELNCMFFEIDPEGDRFVALGNNAAKALRALSLPFFQLPHPSGLNRKLNDKTYVEYVLDECKEYIHEAN